MLATIEESIDQLTALVGNLLDSSRLAAGVVHPDLRRVYLEEVVQRALISIGKGATGFYRSAIDRVKVDVGDAVVMADAGLLERVFANLIDNALRYAPNCVVRVNAGRVGDRVLINVIDEGPGIPHGSRGPDLRSLPAAGRSRQHHRRRAWECRWRAASSKRWAAPLRPATPPAADSPSWWTWLRRSKSSAHR